jgi:hypothetical protein
MTVAETNVVAWQFAGTQLSEQPGRERGNFSYVRLSSNILSARIYVYGRKN